MSSFTSGDRHPRKYRFYVLTFLFSLFLALAFAPNSFAYTTLFHSPSSSHGSTLKLNVYGGCAITNYNFGNDFYMQLGNSGYSGYTSNFSPLYNCGYRWNINNNGKFNYFNHAWGLVRTLTIGSDGTTTTDTYASTGGSTNSIFSYNADFANLNFDIYNQIEDIQYTYSLTNNANLVLPTSNTSMCAEGVSVCESNAILMFKFDVPSTAGVMNTGVKISSSSFITSNWNRDVSSTLTLINDNTVRFCGEWPEQVANSSDILDDLFPDFWDDIPSGYYRCGIYSIIPLVPDGYLTINGGSRNIQFVTLPASSYNKNGWILEGNLLSQVGLDYYSNLANYGFPWTPMFISPSYKDMGARNDQSFKFINPDFVVLIPDNVEDSSALNNLAATANISNSTTTNGTSSGLAIDDDETPDNTSIMSWFNVFDGLNVLFPFGVFFSSFVSPDTCYSIPTLASWLNLPSDTTYCSWWPSTVVNALTPIFTFISLMLLFGFVVSWLRGDRAYSIFHERSN